MQIYATLSEVRREGQNLILVLEKDSTPETIDGLVEVLKSLLYQDVYVYVNRLMPKEELIRQRRKRIRRSRSRLSHRGKREMYI
ncbi:MAG: hypothetical protein DRO12_05050 [Thermoprotei archaeon]|nr:MAG: hypothetical protein DRO12_05050 [Thermoprotei archaeon]